MTSGANRAVLFFESGGIFLLTAGIFALDLVTPRGTVVWMLYLIPLLLTYFSPRERDPLYFSVLFTLLVWLGFMLAPAGLPEPYALLNRGLGLTVMWAFALAMHSRKKTRRQLDRVVVQRTQAETQRDAAVEARAYAETGLLGAVTGRQQLEQSLTLSELRLNSIVQSAMDAIITVDDEQKILQFNAAAENMFQCRAAEALGQSLDRFIPQRFRDAHRQHVRAFSQSGTTSRTMGRLGVVTGLRANGEEFPVEAAISQIGMDGRKYFTVILRDRTERAQLEAQLRLTERLAEMGTLASGMAHEIGTPMNVILGRAEQLLRRTEDDTVKKGLATIVAQVERITKIMNQLLTFARRKPSERRKVNLGQTIEDCLEVLQERLRRARVQVESSYETALRPVHVHADPDQMSQVFLNLLINAIHAMPDGGTLRISLEQADSHVKAVIADTGHGIAKEDLPKIFNPFFTTKEVGKGTGLGLTVVHGIIQEHGGSIAVDSEAGRGATFTVTLPAAKSV